MKICSKCKVKKPLTEFNKNKRSPDGHRPDCKICKNKVSKDYYKRNQHNMVEKAQKRYYEKTGRTYEAEFKPTVYKEKELNFKLPEYISLTPNQEIKSKYERYEFIDSRYGRYTTTIRALEKKGYSTHPLASYDRTKKTLKSRRGVENPGQCPEIREKMRQTNFKKYNVENPSHSEEIQNKISEANKNNVNTRIPKLKNTIQEKYGVDNISQHREFKLKKTKHILGNWSIRELAQRYSKDYTITVKYFNRLDKKTFLRWLFSEQKGTDIEVLFSEAYKVKRYNKQYKTEDGTIFKPDFKLSDRLYLNTHGLWWHCEENTKNNRWGNKQHFKQREDFEKNGDTLLQFYADEIYNKMDIILSMVNSKLGIYDQRIYARNTEIRPVKFDVANVFYNDNHIMGFGSGCKNVGLYYDGELVCCMGYKKHNDGCDITRFCSKLNTQVVGGMSKLLSYIEKNNDYAYIQYMVDLRYGKNSIESLGFELKGITLGFNWTDKNKRYSRVRIQGKNQSQQAEDRGWYKIWDAGQAKYIKQLK